MTAARKIRAMLPVSVSVRRLVCRVEAFTPWALDALALVDQFSLLCRVPSDHLVEAGVLVAAAEVLEVVWGQVAVAH